jgi:hypothetical protein
MSSSVIIASVLLSFIAFNKLKFSLEIDSFRIQLKRTYVDPFSSVESFELGVIAKLNLFFFRNEPFLVLMVKLSAIKEFNLSLVIWWLVCLHNGVSL